MKFDVNKPPQSICILRLSAIGDVCHMVAIVQLIQRHWPQCSITWVIGKREAELVAGLLGVEFIIFDKKGGFTAINQFRRQMKARRFDVLLHMQAAIRASALSLFIHAPIKIGFDRKRARDFQWLFTTKRIAAKSQQHVIKGFLEFIKSLGIDDPYLSWHVPIPIEDEIWADNICDPNKLILIINPSASNSQRNWLTKRYVAVVRYAILQHGMQVILTGGPARQEINLANTIVQQVPEVINCVGQTSLKQLLALIKRATVMIAPDTGPAHMATMVNVPVIGLYAGSNPLRTGPYLSQEYTINRYPQALQRSLGKSIEQVRWGQRVRDLDAMSLITENDVIQQLDKIIAQSQSGKCETSISSEKNRLAVSENALV